MLISCMVSKNVKPKANLQFSHWQWWPHYNEIHSYPPARLPYIEAPTPPNPDVASYQERSELLLHNVGDTSNRTCGMPIPPWCHPLPWLCLPTQRPKWNGCPNPFWTTNRPGEGAWGKKTAFGTSNIKSLFWIWTCLVGTIVSVASPTLTTTSRCPVHWPKACTTPWRNKGTLLPNQKKPPKKRMLCWSWTSGLINIHQILIFVRLFKDLCI